IVELQQSFVDQFGGSFNIIPVNTDGARPVAIGDTGTISSFLSGQTAGLNFGILAPGSFDINAATGANGAAERSKIQYLLRLFKSDNRANVIQAPRLMAADNTTSKLTVGSKVQVPQGFSQTTVPGQLPIVNFTSEDLGLTMDIKPRITKGDFISMTFKVE